MKFNKLFLVTVVMSFSVSSVFSQTAAPAAPAKGGTATATVNTPAGSATGTATVGTQPAGTQPADASKTPKSGDVSGTIPVEPLEKIILDDFEEADDWRAKSTTPIGETKVLKMIQRGYIKDVFDEKTVPEVCAKRDSFSNSCIEWQYSNQDEKIGKNHVMGVKTFFDNRGFDRVEITPPNEYIIKGRARQIGIWVLGRKYRHTLFIKLRDYKGNTHNIRMGKLDFFGWRKLTATIPGYIPQSTRFSLLDKNINFVSIFVTSDVHEVGGDFYFYVEDLEIRSDKYDLIYPGYEIKDNW